MRILVIEDNSALVANVFEYFEARGHVMDAAPDGRTGLRLATANDYDAIVLDLSLPGLDGLDICRRLRAEAHSDVPVIALTARDALPDKLAGFEAGADDYLTKPFALAELEARLSALSRRVRRAVAPAAPLQVADLHYDPRTRRATRGGQVLTINPTGRRILEILMRASPGVVTRERLEHELWGDMPPGEDTLRAHVYALRKAIDRPFDVPLLHTLPRTGYRLAESDDGG
jgi:DNA-binding response OmpR family regulator